HRASVDGNKLTKLGNDNFIMAYAHIAHDCNIGNNIIIANATTFGGHCTVEDFAFIGGLVAVHQFVSVGRYSMIGGFSAINKDIPPYTTASNDRAKLYGLNTIGLKRRNFDDETIQDLKKAYKLLFRSKLPMKDAIESIKKEVRQCDAVKNFISFAEKNKRGLCR
nr:acyl-[acyl-carrier-protein]--UDP-N-acetylglucosamine O-acyltransferase [bacterium]